MRTLVLSDIHGNWPALEAVAAVPHDAVMCLGDIVGYGPQPGECLRWLRASHACIVQGNHERSVADGVPPRCRLDFEWLAAATLHIARRQLTDDETAFLRTLPRTRDLVLDGKRVVLLHATPADPLYSYLGPDRDKWRTALAGIPKLERASYPVERTVDALGAAGLDPAALGALSALLRTGRAGGSEPRSAR